MTPDTKRAMIDGHATRNFIVTAMEGGSRGMEHVAFNWTPGRPIRVTAALTAARLVVDQVTRQQDVLKASANYLKFEPTALVPCVLEEVKAYHDKAFQALGLMELRAKAVVRAIHAVCPHKAAFPLDNPADAGAEVPCSDCNLNRVSAREVYDGNSRSPSAQIMHVWNQLHRKRPAFLAEYEQRRSRILSALSALPAQFPTKADAPLLASLEGVLRADMAKLDEECQGKVRVRRDFEIDVEAHMGVFHVLDAIGATSIRDAAAVELAADLIGEFVTPGTGLQKHLTEFVQKIDIWN